MTKRTVSELYNCYPDTKFFRLTNEKESHNGFQYKSGLNEDTIPFNPSGTCSRGGLYFFADYQVHTYKKYVTDAYYIREVTFDGLEDVLIYDEGDKLKANKFNLGERELFKDALKLIKHTPDNIKEFIKLNPESVKYVTNNLSYDSIISILNNKNIAGLKYIKPDMITMSICYTAILNNGLSLEYVPEEFHTYDICYLACKINGLSLQFVKQSLFNEKQLNDLYLIAINQNGLALQYVDKKLLTEKLCLEAVKQNSKAVEIIINEDNLSNTSSILTHLIKSDHTSIMYTYKKYLTEEVCLAAVSKYGDHLYLIPDDKKTYNICLAAVKNKGLALEYVPDEYKTYELCYAAVVNDGLALEFVKNQCYELCDIALRQNYKSFIFIKDHHEDFNLYVINNSCNTIEFKRDGYSSFLIRCLKLMKDPFDNVEILKYFVNNLYYDSIWSDIFENMNISDKILIKIITKRPSIFEFIKNPSQEVCNYALELDNSLIRCIKNPDENILIKMVNDKKLTLKQIKHHTFNLCKQIIEMNPTQISYVKLNNEDPNYKEQMNELCTIAVNKGVELRHIDPKFHTIEICSAALKNDKNYFENNNKLIFENNIKLIVDVNIRKGVREKFNIW